MKTSISKLFYEIVFNVHLIDCVKGKVSTSSKMKANTSIENDRFAINSFLSYYNSESKKIAHLGYRDLTEFRKCQMSFHVGVLTTPDSHSNP